MRRNRIGAAVWCGVVGWVCATGTARAEWLTVRTGAAGNAHTVDEAEFWYGPHSPPFVAVNELTGTGTVTATTGGGWVYFAGPGTPVVLSLADGSASLTGGTVPSGAGIQGPGGSSAGSLASAAPQAGGPIPGNAALLGVSVSAGAGSAKILAVSLSENDGSNLMTETLQLPDGGWWVIGLGPGAEPPTKPLPEPEPEPEPAPPTPPSPTPGVPEPATIALLSSGTVFVLPWLRRRLQA